MGHPQVDFSKQPFLTIWETTRACDLACVHCRAEAEPDPDPNELSHEEALKLIQDVGEMGTPILIFSGGDPLKRKGLAELIRYANSLGLRTGAIPAVTSLLTREKVSELKQANLSQIAFSLDSARAEDHDAFRKTEGVFAKTLEAVERAHECGLPVQINSLVNLHNMATLDGLVSLIECLGIVFWEIFFLVPTGRGKDLPMMEADLFEEAFAKIYELSQRASFIIKVTEAPHYRRFCYEKELAKQGLNPELVRKGEIRLPAMLRMPHGPHGTIGHAPQGVNSGKGFLFVSHTGDIMPNGFLPIAAGNVRTESLQIIYREHPLFRELRDSTLLKGRCGICPYKDICGGSRARAFALTGDYLEEDPHCSYRPELAGF